MRNLMYKVRQKIKKIKLSQKILKFKVRLKLKMIFKLVNALKERFKIVNMKVKKNTRKFLAKKMQNQVLRG